MSKFPHLKESTDFPRVDNVDVYKDKNNFDYERYDKGLKIELCNVKWKSDYSDTVDWQTEKKRDSYFSSITKKITLESAINKYPEGAINLPLPFNEVHKYNYIILTFNPFANKDDFVDYETEDSINKYFFFIDSCEMAAANSTKCNLVLDIWTTYIARININYLMLARGHAPLAAVSVEEYLENPIDKNELLLAPDINYGTCDNVTASADAVLNDGEMYACIATLSDPTKSFGTMYEDGWQTPSFTFNKEQGVPAYFVFALDSQNLASFLQNADSSIPQFKQTVQAIFFIPKKLVTVTNSFTFLNTTCYYLNAEQKNMKLLDLKKEDFKYPEKYAHLTKLYTFPYAYVEISDASGKVLTVKIENTDGKVSIETLLSIAFPHLGIDVFFGGVGGENERTISFKNLDLKNVTIGGRWYEYFQHWDIPCYEVVQDAYTNYNFNTHWQRQQMKNDAEIMYTNNLATYENAKDNGTATSNTHYTNTVNGANTTLTNQNIANTASRNNQLANNSLANFLKDVKNKSNQASQAWDAGLQEAVTNANIDAIANSTGATATTSFLGGLINYGLEIAEAISGSGGDGTIPAPSTTSRASMANGIMGAFTQGVNYNVISSKLTTIKDAVIHNSQMQVNNVNGDNENNTRQSNATHLANMERNISASLSQTTNSTNTQKTNAGNSKNTEIANINRTYNKDKANATRTRLNAYEQINNNVRQNKLKTPISFGINKGSSRDVTMPQMLTANLVTQSKGEIAQAANEFLRYGYTLGQQWDFNGFSVMKNFSYWRASEVWLYSNEGVNNAILDYIRSILIKGTTVWTSPENVCSVSIFDN